MKRSRIALAAMGLLAVVGTLAITLTTANRPASAQQQSAGWHRFSDSDWDRYGTYNTAVIRWHGSVDDTVDVIVRADQVHSQVVRGQDLQDESVRVDQPMPIEPVHVTLVRTVGRGRIWVTQQPSRENDYTAIVRIRDKEAGRDNYFFALAWQ